jgi:hypothetical protein
VQLKAAGMSAAGPEMPKEMPMETPMTAHQVPRQKNACGTGR